MQNDVFLGKDEGQLSTGGPAARATGDVGRTNQHSSYSRRTQTGILSAKFKHSERY